MHQLARRTGTHLEFNWSIRNTLRSHDSKHLEVISGKLAVHARCRIARAIFMSVLYCPNA
jgi:hypothetical protein